MDDMFGGTDTKKDGQNAGFSQADVTAMISADASIKQSKVQGSVAGRMESRADALEIEIKLDEARGGDAAKKKEELADVKQTAMQAADSQMKTLGNANQAMEKAAEAERTAPKDSGSKEKNTERAENKAADTDAKEEVQESVSDDAQEDNIEHVQPDNEAQEDSTERVQPDNDVQTQEAQPVQPAVSQIQVVQAEGYPHFDVRF